MLEPGHAIIEFNQNETPCMLAYCPDPAKRASAEVDEEGQIQMIRMLLCVSHADEIVNAIGKSSR